MSIEIAEFAFDLHAGLADYDVPDFNDLRTVGMAATLAIHIRGLGAIPYEVLRGVSGYYWGIPSIALDGVVRLLVDVGFVRLVESGRKIEQVLPQIPIFEDVYRGIGEYTTSELSLNEHENTTLRILSELQAAPQNRDALFNKLGADKAVFGRTLEIGRRSGIVTQHLARGRNILLSPFYFADNHDALADAAAAHGAPNIRSALALVKENQGWPMSLVSTRGEIGHKKLSPVESALVEKLAAEGVMKPPTVIFGNRTESFVFTPQPGRVRLNAAKKQIYERAMALIASVRKGQLLAEEYKIRSPLAILRVLRDRGYIASNSEAFTQYHNLVVLLVGTLKPGLRGYQFHLNRTPENEAALNLAIRLLTEGSLSGMEVDDDARLALTKDEQFIQSLVSSRNLRAKPMTIQNEEANYEFEQLILNL